VGILFQVTALDPCSGVRSDHALGIEAVSRSDQEALDLYFMTFICYRRQPRLISAHAKQLFGTALERAR
jgi:hypothetical protein